MANGFFQPKPNRFLLASQLFRQAPTTHWTGALAQALGGLTAGIGQRRQKADIAQQKQAFQQALLGSLPAGRQAQAGIPPTAQVMPVGQQPTPVGMPAQPIGQPQQAVTGGLPPQVISQLIAGGQPQLAFQLTQQAKAQQLAAQQAQQAREQEQATLQQQQAFKTQQQKQAQEFQMQKLQQTEALREQAEKSRRAFEIRLKEGLIAPPSKQVAISEASAKGVPAQAPDITSGFTPETAQKVKLESFKSGQAFLKNTARLQLIRGQKDVLFQMDRALGLLKQGVKTGRIVGADVAGAAPATLFSEKAQEFMSIVDKMTPLMRAGLPGNASDRDVAMFRSATVGLDKAPNVNKNIIKAMRMQSGSVLEKSKFEDNYFAVHKNLIGADSAWNEYRDFNPIFIPGSPTFELNPRRMSAKDWFDKINQGFSPQEILSRQAQ